MNKIHIFITFSSVRNSSSIQFYEKTSCPINISEGLLNHDGSVKVSDIDVYATLLNRNNYLHVFGIIIDNVFGEEEVSSITFIIILQINKPQQFDYYC